MEATVEYMDVGRGAGYYEIRLKIGSHTLTTTSDWQHLQSLEKAQEIADSINKKLEEKRK